MTRHCRIIEHGKFQFTLLPGGTLNPAGEFFLAVPRRAGLSGLAAQKDDLCCAPARGMVE